MADPRKPEAQNETVQRASEDGEPSTQSSIPPPDDDEMKRSAESGEGDVPERDLPEEPGPVEQDLPSNRAQERGGP
jgi:hypothetical protein